MKWKSRSQWCRHQMAREIRTSPPRSQHEQDDYVVMEQKRMSPELYDSIEAKMKRWLKTWRINNSNVAQGGCDLKVAMVLAKCNPRGPRVIVIPGGCHRMWPRVPVI